MHAVLDTPELLEMICLYLPMKSLACDLRVSKRWQQTVLDSIQLRRQLFLAPTAPTTYGEWRMGVNPRWYFDLSVWQPVILSEPTPASKVVVQTHPILVAHMEPCLERVATELIEDLVFKSMHQDTLIVQPSVQKRHKKRESVRVACDQAFRQSRQADLLHTNSKALELAFGQSPPCHETNYLQRLPTRRSPLRPRNLPATIDASNGGPSGQREGETNELLELICSHLPTDALTCALRDSKHWHEVILASTKLRRQLFLDPAPPTLHLERRPDRANGYPILHAEPSSNSRIVVEAHPALDMYNLPTAHFSTRKNPAAAILKVHPVTFLT